MSKNQRMIDSENCMW